MSKPPSQHGVLSTMKTQRRRTSASSSSSSHQQWTAFRRRPSQLALSRRHHSISTSNQGFSDSSVRSSGDSLLWSDVSNDSDNLSTPGTEYQDDSIECIAQQPDEKAVAEVDLPQYETKDASTILVTEDTQAAHHQKSRDAGGTQLIEKYCCGGGCCFRNAPPPIAASRFFSPIEQPENEAYRSLNLKLGFLTQETVLTGITPYPEQNVTLEKPDASSSSEPSTTKMHPPTFVQPHPPYTVFSAPLFHARELTKPGAEKRTFHFDIDVTDYPTEGGTDFKVGGAIGVCPPNQAESVDEIFDLLGVPRFLRDKPVVLHTAGGRWPTIWGDEASRTLYTTRRELLAWCVDIQSYPPKKTLLRLLSAHAAAANEHKILEYLASAEGQPAFCDLRTGAHLSLIQLLRAFPSSRPPLEELLGVLDQLMPRFYSLSNDPHVSSSREGVTPGRRLIEIAVTIHESPDWSGGVPRAGVGSGFLERLARQFLAAEAAHYVDPENNPMPDLGVPMFRGLMANPLSKEFGVSNGPMMLIGAGVGMAPFRGFILNRLQNANCANKIWLVQGVRDSSVDELYSGELGKYEDQIKKVVQSRAWKRRKPHGADRVPRIHSADDLVALRQRAQGGTLRAEHFSEAKAESRYVQDELRQQADIVWDVIHAVDGRIFVCGSSKGMGEGVERALRDVAREKGGWDDEGAKRFWEEQKEKGRFVMEVW